MKWYQQFLDEAIDFSPPFTDEKQAKKFAPDFKVKGEVKDFGPSGSFTTYMTDGPEPQPVQKESVELTEAQRTVKRIKDLIKLRRKKNKVQLKFHTGTDDRNLGGF